MTTTGAVSTCLLVAILATGCASSATSAHASAPSSGEAFVTPRPDVGATESGDASYYADSLAGHATASGEPYDPSDFTAAHKKLAFGTVVDVTDDAGHTTRVRVNDRGPFTKGRVIDLSGAAADALAMRKRGVAHVTLTVVSTPPKKKR